MKRDNMELICSVQELAGLFRSQSNLKGFLQEVANLVGDHMRADACSIFLADKASLVLKATRGLNPESVEKVRLAPGEGITGQAFLTMRPISVARVAENEMNKQVSVLEEEKYQSILAVPILHGSVKVGAIVLHHSTPDHFHRRDERAMSAIAGQLAAMVENTQLLISLHEAQSSSPASEAAPRYLRGKSAGRGIAIGTTFVFREDLTSEFTVPHGEYRQGLADFQGALDQTQAQLEQLQVDMEKRLSDLGSLIFSSHLLMLRDDSFSGSMITLIKEGAPATSAVYEVVNEYIRLFGKADNPMVQEKVLDLKDLGHRLLRNLSAHSQEEGDYTGQVIVARELLPSELVKLAAQRAEGFVLEGASATAHIVILSKSLKLPVLMLDRGQFPDLCDELDVVVDGYQGAVHVNPPKEVLDNYREMIVARAQIKENAGQYRDKTITADGTEVRLLANINLLSDLLLAKKVKAQGIGLYRSEFPFIIRSTIPSEEEQYLIYRRIRREMRGKQVVMRTLDVGGDKALTSMPHGNEANPFLGLRALRFAMKNRDIFTDQIRALLRAGDEGDLEILLPMVEGPDDFMEARGVIHETIERLVEDGYSCCRTPRIGAMVELPSAVLLIDELAREADFLSLGTNDLIQYTLGVDRTNENVSPYYNAHHPAILHSLERVAAAAETHGTSLSICGDAATDPALIKFLLGLGVRSFSMDPGIIPEVQSVLMGMDCSDAPAFARHLLSLKSTADVEQFLTDEGLVDLEEKVAEA